MKLDPHLDLNYPVVVRGFHVAFIAAWYIL